ncbi:MAG: hypothetical protein ABSB26_01230 [Nitrososphaerales archaeon]
MNRRTVAIIVIVALGLSAFILLAPVIPFSASSCPPPCNPPINLPKEYESISLNLFGVGGFYVPQCGAYHWQSGNYVLSPSCAYN